MSHFHSNVLHNSDIPTKQATVDILCAGFDRTRHINHEVTFFVKFQVIFDSYFDNSRNHNINPKDVI